MEQVLKINTLDGIIASVNRQLKSVTLENLESGLPGVSLALSGLSEEIFYPSGGSRLSPDMTTTSTGAILLRLLALAIASCSCRS